MCEGKLCDICERIEENKLVFYWCMDCNDVLCEICFKVYFYGKIMVGYFCLFIVEMRRIFLEMLMK